MKHGPIALRRGRGYGCLYGVCLASRSATACPRSVTHRWCAGCSTGAHAQEAEAQDRACASHKSRRVHTSVNVAHMLSRAALRTEVLPPYPHLYHSAMYRLWHCHKTLAKQSNILYDHQQTNEPLLCREPILLRLKSLGLWSRREPSQAEPGRHLCIPQGT